MPNSSSNNSNNNQCSNSSSLNSKPSLTILIRLRCDTLASHNSSNSNNRMVVAR